MAIDLDLLIPAMRFVRNPQDDKIQELALVLLKMNRNQILYRNIQVRPQYMKDTLVYNLRKCINERVPRLSAEQRKKVEDALGEPLAPKEEKKAETDDETDPSFQSDENCKDSGDAAVAEALKKQPGQRDDHEQLPDEVKSLFDGSKDRWFAMRDLHDKLQTMDGVDAAERAPLTRELRRLFGEYRKCLNDYDHFDAAAKKEEPEVNIAQVVATARKYLSDNREKLAAAIEAKDEQKADKLRTKMQQRIRIIQEAKLGFDPAIQKTLTQLGLHFD